MQVIRRTIMINKDFWNKIAGNWVKNDDGIVVPDEMPSLDIDVPDIEISNDEIDDILADLDLDL